MKKDSEPFFASIFGLISIPSFKRKNKVSPSEDKKTINNLYREDFLSNVMVSTLIIPIMIFYLIYAGCISYFNPWTVQGVYKCSAIVTMLVASLVMVATWVVDHKYKLSPSVAENFSFYFDLLLMVGVFLFFLSDIHDSFATYGDTYPVGFSASFFWFLAFAIYPAANLIAFIVVSLCMFGGTLGILIPFWGQLQFAFQYLVVILGVLAIGFYFRCYRYRNAINDIRSQEKTKNLIEQSNTDELTGIGNRRAMDDFMTLYLTHAYNKDTTLTLIIFDVDNFKSYNDGLSHLAGDDCLVRVVKACQKAFPNEFADFYRFGGDEFVVLLSNIAKEKIPQMLLLMLKKVADEKIAAPSDLHKPYMTISIGASSFHVDATYKFANQIKASDEALYKAKDNGKNQAYYGGTFYSLKK